MVSFPSPLLPLHRRRWLIFHLANSIAGRIIPPVTTMEGVHLERPTPFLLPVEDILDKVPDLIFGEVEFLHRVSGSNAAQREMQTVQVDFFGHSALTSFCPSSPPTCSLPAGPSLPAAWRVVDGPL